MVDIQNNIEPMVGAFSCDRVLAIHSKERDDGLETAGTHYKPGDVRIEKVEGRGQEEGLKHEKPLLQDGLVFPGSNGL